MFDFLFKNEAQKSVATPLSFYNTLSKTKEAFAPSNPRGVSLYTCGPTVYGEQHIGNMRPPVVSSVIRNVLAYNGYTVKQVINITDVGHLTDDGDHGDDKIEKAAQSQHISAKVITEKYTDAFLRDIKALNVPIESIEFPKATGHINEQIAAIQTLEEKGYTYTTTDGIYFDTSKFPTYGALGGIDIEGLKEGARVHKNTEKKNPTDFALWKFTKDNEKRQQDWETPWGKGFPGWHIECSAMSMKYLGKTIDIHTGGIEHIPVHHNNEIAQSESLTGKRFVRFWLHHAHVMIEGKKISKSLGNTIYVRQIGERGFSPIAYRYLLLTVHYRTQFNFTWEALESAQTALFRVHKLFAEELGTTNGAIHAGYQKQFHAAINDDLNTPQAIAVMWEMLKDDNVSKADKRATLLDFDRVLNIGIRKRNDELNALIDTEVKTKDLPGFVQKLVEERESARKSKDWAKADELRDAIKKAGFTVIDTDSGPEISKI